MESQITCVIKIYSKGEPYPTLVQKFMSNVFIFFNLSLKELRDHNR